MTDGHSARNGVGIDDNIGGDSLARKRHILKANSKIKKEDFTISSQPHIELGISKALTSCLYSIPIVPFCPCRLANLSPICGTRMDLT